MRQEQGTLPGVPRPRGRPRTGKAKSSRERQRAHRERQADAGRVRMELSLPEAVAVWLDEQGGTRSEAVAATVQRVQHLEHEMQRLEQEVQRLKQQELTSVVESDKSRKSFWRRIKGK